MMLSPTLIKTLITNLQTVIRDEAHFKQLVDGLCNTIKDTHLDGSFDALAFVWAALPQWARVLLLTAAYREDKQTFKGITPLSPLEQLSETQRVILSHACDKLLIAVVTLMADYRFTDDFYRGWLEARRAALHNHNQQKETV